MVSMINFTTNSIAERPENQLSEAAQKFLENVYIYGQDGIPQKVEDYQAIRAGWWAGSIAVSQKAQQLYLQKEIEPQVMGGVPVFIATPKKWAPIHDDKIIFYVHGGAFTLGATEHLVQVFAQVADETGLKVVSLNYRLAPEHPFPAGLEDCFSVYKELLKTYKPENIAFLGDSAGGNLCIATALKARDEMLGMPGAMALFSPFVNMNKGKSYETNHDPHMDYERSILPHIKAYAPKENPYDHPLICLTKANLKGLPPLIAQTGTRDALQSDSIEFVEKAKGVGVDATLFSMPGIWHGVVQEIDMPEADEARHRIAVFIKGHLRL